MDITRITQAVETIAEELGIDLQAYGNASPTRLIIASLSSAVQILQETTQIAITEQNPLTATEFRSRIGLAALVGLNPLQLMQASVGKVRVEPGTHTVTIGQHAKLLSYDNIDYYVVLPTETVKFSEATELMVRQGILKSASFTSTGEPWESFKLTVDNYVDALSVEMFVGTERKKVGFKLDEQADAYIRPSYDGDVEIVVPSGLDAGTSFTVQYADCIGIDGDNLNAGQYMQAKEFAYEGDEDVSSDIKVVISEPIIGGIDFEQYDTMLSNAIRLAGHNNLIGTEAQIVEYASRFKQYTVQSAKTIDGVFTLTALRSLEMLTKTMDYWTACQNLTMRDIDIIALSNHLNNYGKKSLDAVVNVRSAKQEQCRVNVDVRMTEAAPESILDIVIAYLLERFKVGTYETAGLYRSLIALDGVQECAVSFSGYVNSFGTAIPTNDEAILVCSAADIVVNNVRYTYGSFDMSALADIIDIVDTVTTERIVDINTDIANSTKS